MGARNAANGLPQPVGAATTTCLPLRMAGYAFAWGSVGPGKVALNQRWMAGWKGARAMEQIYSFGATRPARWRAYAERTAAQTTGQDHGVSRELTMV